jgi:hypothetical protein
MMMNVVVDESKGDWSHEKRASRLIPSEYSRHYHHQQQSSEQPSAGIGQA